MLPPIWPPRQLGSRLELICPFREDGRLPGYTALERAISSNPIPILE